MEVQNLILKKVVKMSFANSNSFNRIKSKIGILSLNVGMKKNLAGLRTIISDQNVDIVFLQEVRLTGDQIESLLRGFKSVSNIDNDDISRPGVAMAWRQELPVQDVSNIVPCRLQIATLGSVKLLNLYAPSGSSKVRERYLFCTRDVFPVLQIDDKASWLWAGDYNCVLHPLDLEGGKGFNQKKCTS